MLQLDTPITLGKVPGKRSRTAGMRMLGAFVARLATYNPVLLLASGVFGTVIVLLLLTPG
ncbi:hypothetical protein [Marinobacterium aestuariivivens]|uniref:Uncharacterized protein n=1 Tax=Marinobacterium aestuariivivens TaxID=1698799 RepID=A0ABW2A7P4_9GAMM